MGRSNRHSVPQSIRRRLISGVTLLAHLACAFGFPLPYASAGRGACGTATCCCGNADECRASGCGCTHQAEPAIPKCCATKRPPVKACGAKGEAKSKPVRWTIGIAAQKCRGGQTHWISADLALPGPTPTDWRPSWPYCYSVPTALQVHFELTEAPIDPPPRTVVG